MTPQEQRYEIEQAIKHYGWIVLHRSNEVNERFVLSLLEDMKKELLYNLDLEKVNKKFLCMGRISKEKGMDILFEALKILDKNEYNLEFQIAGAGDKELTRQLKKDSKKLKHIKVKFIGQVSGKAKGRFLKQDGIFIQPSLWEGSSYALLEMMLWEHPIIVSNNSGSKDIFKYKDRNFGTIVNFDDETKRAINLANAIEESMGWNYIKMGQEAQEEIKERYNLDKIVQKYIGIYRESMENGDKNDA